MKPNTITCLQPPTRTRLFVLFLSILCLVGMPRAGLADTYVSGVIAGQTWTAASSPYRVVGNIGVALLTINPGVTVFFESNYVFEVDGFLTAVGTGAQPIIFACTNGGGWQGIFFNNCYDGSRLAYCQIRNSLNSGVRCVNADAIIQSCVLANNSSGNDGGGIYVDNRAYPGSEILIQNCIITNNTAAGAGGGALAVSMQ
jgi:predicted outer membrane repeat protein